MRFLREFFCVCVQVSSMSHVFFLADVAECAGNGFRLCPPRHSCFGVCVVLYLLVFQTHSLFFLFKHACFLFLSLSFVFCSHTLVCACSLAFCQLTISLTKHAPVYTSVSVHETFSTSSHYWRWRHELQYFFFPPH